MLRLLGFVFLASIWCALTQPANAGGNFAFTAQAESGLHLEITGFGSSGKQLFDLPASEETSANGTSNYTVHVDEQIIFADRPGRWCLMLLSGHSSRLPAAAPLCDAKPQEIRGTYVFQFPAAASVAKASPQTADQLLALGYAYATGSGAPKDDAKAADYYQKAADAGSIPAMRNLAGMYGSGTGVAKDDTKAKALFLSAAEAGDAQAQYALANWYLTDRNEKIMWLQRAAAQGHSEAIGLLKQMGVALASSAAAESPGDVATGGPSDAKSTEPVAPGSPVGPSHWRWTKSREGFCVVQGDPTSTDATWKRGAPPVVYVANATYGNPDDVGVNIGTPPDHAQFFALIDGIAYPMRPAGPNLIPLARSVDPSGAVLDFSYKAWRLAGKAMVMAMSRGKILELEVHVMDGPNKGAVYKDTYSLDGFGPTKAAADQNCAGLAEQQLATFTDTDSATKLAVVSQPPKNAIECVQEEFAALGLYHGGIDGALSKETLTAASAYGNRFGAYTVDLFGLQKLDKKWATMWCLELARKHRNLTSISASIAAQATITFGVDVGAGGNLPAISLVANGRPLKVIAPDTLESTKIAGKTLHLATFPYTDAAELDSICLTPPAGFDVLDKGGQRYGNVYCLNRASAGFLAAEIRDWLTVSLVAEKGQ